MNASPKTVKMDFHHRSTMLAGCAGMHDVCLLMHEAGQSAEPDIEWPPNLATRNIFFK